jgi:hypothetical protein
MYADVRPSDEFERLIFEGRIAYDESSAEECRELGESCTLGKPGVCADLWEGTVPTGGTCTTAVECAGLATCWYDSDSEGTGTCEPMLEPGEPCTTADRCAAHGTENATCIDVNGEKQCRVSVPLPDAVEGSRCGAWLEGDELVQAGCVQGAFCNEEGICTTFFAPGEACELNGIGCGNEAQCWGTCLPIVTRDAEGEPCGVEDELVGDCNPEWLACVDGVCEPKGDGSQGAICDVHQYFNACDEGLDCRSGRCVRVQ